jgi:hypothetical protein
MADLDDFMKACPDRGAAQQRAHQAWLRGLTAEQKSEFASGSLQSPHSSGCLLWEWPTERVLTRSLRWREACARCAATAECDRAFARLSAVGDEQPPDFSTLYRIREASACPKR